jgi:sec-independent protein translocase protein TatC
MQDSNHKKEQPGKKKSSRDEMSFLEHLEELRWHLIRSILVVLVITALAFVYKKIVFDVIILGPQHADFITNRLLCKLADKLSVEALCINQAELKLINYKMTGQFMAHIMISIIAGLIVAFPYILHEAWRFIRPALHENERTYTTGVIFYCTILFLLGVGFGYFVIAPLSVNFLGNYAVSHTVENLPQLMSYVSLVTTITLASGVLFELPILVYFLSKVGLVTPEFLRKYRRHALVIILVISAIITPPDVFSQILVSFPLLLLYEISIMISKRVIKKENAKFEADN